MYSFYGYSATSQLEAVFVNGAWSWFVRAKHGWWDGKKAVNHTTTLSPEARAWFERQQKFRASEGFAYAFSIDFFAPGGAIVWRKIEGR